MKLNYLIALLSSIASSVTGEDLRSAKISSESPYLGNQQVTPKIVGGTFAGNGNYPWYSALYRNNNGGETINDFYCGGQLVAKDFVLTAAHCKPGLGDLVIVGALCPYEDGNCGQPRLIRRVAKVFEDPRFKMEITFVLGYDFLLVQLDNDVDSITPVELDNGSYAPSYPSGKSVWAIGLGLVDVEAQTIAREVQHIELSYIPEIACREEMLPANLGESTICAGHDAGTGDACNGDSGGPLFDRENQVLVGLTSYGDAECVSESPGVYARIADNWSWIKSIVCSNTSEPKPDLCSDSPEPFTDSPTKKWCSGGADVDILVATDLWPNETIWAISELNADEVLVAGLLESFDKDESHEGNFCLPLDNDQCYSFVIFDQAGDGIDISGDDPDYCVSVNGQSLECEINFEGNMETVVFPADSCNKSCKPETYRLKGKTPGYPVATAIEIQDSEGNTYSINQYSLEGAVPDTDFDFHLDLCAGCYSLVVQNPDSTEFALFDGAGNTVVTQRDFSTSFFSSTDSEKFCVGVGTSSGATMLKGASFLLTALLVLNNILF